VRRSRDISEPQPRRHAGLPCSLASAGKDRKRRQEHDRESGERAAEATNLSSGRSGPRRRATFDTAAGETDITTAAVL
jgi:hypothetical protein